jgi:hypothetical protein
VHTAAFSADSEWLVSASSDGSVRVWSVRHRRQVYVFDDHVDEVMSASFSPDGRWVAALCLDRTIRLWRLPDAGNALRMMLLPAHTFSCGGDDYTAHADDADDAVTAAEKLALVTGVLRKCGEGGNATTVRTAVTHQRVSELATSELRSLVVGASESVCYRAASLFTLLDEEARRDGIRGISPLVWPHNRQPIQEADQRLIRSVYTRERARHMTWLRALMRHAQDGA